jgi:serine protease Do
MVSVLEKVNGELAGLSEKVQSSLVSLNGGAGAGTIWHADGLVLTNAHVLRDRRVTITLPDGSEKVAQILAMDKHRDLAALTIDAKDLPTIELGNSRELQPGEWVIAYGHPWGVQGAATAGVVIGNSAQVRGNGFANMDWLAVSLHYRPGHSGGPLVDASGRLVGINTVMAGPDVGLAVPIHEIKHFLKGSLG